MAIDQHTIHALDGSSSTFTDRTIVGFKAGVANLIGGGAGQTVTTAVTFAEGLPATYAVVVTPNQAAAAWVTGKTSAGFNVNLAPLVAANTLAVGTFDVLVLA